MEKIFKKVRANTTLQISLAGEMRRLPVSSSAVTDKEMVNRCSDYPRKRATAEKGKYHIDSANLT